MRRSIIAIAFLVAGCRNYDGLSSGFDRDLGVSTVDMSASGDAGTNVDAGLHDLANADLTSHVSTDLAGCVVNNLIDPGEDGVDCGGDCGPCPSVDWGDLDKTQGLAYARDKHLYVVSTAHAAIDRVDPSTGSYMHYLYLPSDAPTTHISLLRSMTGTLLLRADAYIYEIIPETGAMKLVTSPALGAGPSISLSDVATAAGPQSSSLTEGPDGNLYVSLVTNSNTNLGIARVNRTMGDRTIVTSASVGSGAALPSAYEGARLAFTGDGQILMFASNAILSVNPTTGVRSSLALAGATRWPFLPTPQYVQASSTAGAWDVIFRYQPYSMNNGTTVDAAVLRMTLVSGTASFANLSGLHENRMAVAFSGQGTRFIYPMAVAGGEPGETFVLDSSLAGVIRIDDATGNRTVVAPTGSSRGAGPAFSEPVAVTVGTGNDIYVADFASSPEGGAKAVFLVDHVSGDRSFFSSNVDGAGPSFYQTSDEVVTGLALLGSNLALGLLDGTSTARVVDISVSSQARNDAMAPPTLPALQTATIGSDTYVVMPNNASVVKMPSTVVSSNTIGTGPAMRRPQAMCATSTGTLLVADGRSGLLLEIDPSTGNRTLVSGIPLP